MKTSKTVGEKQFKRIDSFGTGTETDVIINEKWDNIELYRKKQESIIEKKRNQSNKESFGIISKLISIKNGGLTSIVGGKSLLKLFVISSAGLLFQLKISRRARKWLPNSFVLFFFLFGVLLFGGSFLLFLNKLKRNNKDKKNKSLKNE